MLILGRCIFYFKVGNCLFRFKDFGSLYFKYLIFDVIIICMVIEFLNLVK